MLWVFFNYLKLNIEKHTCKLCTLASCLPWEIGQIIALHFCIFNIFKKLDKNMAIKTLELVYLKGQLRTYSEGR